MTGAPQNEAEKSPYSYGAAVALCGIFGLAGIHHFYLGNWIHGLFDFGLFALTVFLYVHGNPICILTFLIDFGHSIYIFYKLIVGQQKDSDGRLVTWQ